MARLRRRGFWILSRDAAGRTLRGILIAFALAFVILSPGLPVLCKRDVLAVLTVDGDLRDGAVCVYDRFEWTRLVARSVYVSSAEC